MAVCPSGSWNTLPFSGLLKDGHGSSLSITLRIKKYPTACNCKLDQLYTNVSNTFTSQIKGATQATFSM